VGSGTRVCLQNSVKTGPHSSSSVREDRFLISEDLEPDGVTLDVLALFMERVVGGISEYVCESCKVIV
jgi:hypothetical protein